MVTAAALPPLRQDVTLVPGGDEMGGWRTYVLVDPVRNRYFRIGWCEFEMLARWHCADTRELLARLRAETTLDADENDLAALIGYLASNHLLVLPDSASVARLAAERRAQRLNPLAWLLHHYLFIRIPLVRPDRLLDRLHTLLGGLIRPATLWCLAGLALLALFLVGRQWDAFLATYPYTFGPWGWLGWALALAAGKVIHEMGHALTLKHHGGSVPTMGVAFLVLWPVLYTDTSAAYTLPRRRARLAVAAAGVSSELALAALALLAWSFMPDGPARTAMVMLATTSAATTLLINMSPLMRFDGYYLLSDLLGIPNLQERAFALARHRLRHAALGWREEPPEHLPAAKVRLLLLYAYAAWVYRLVLFLGIAVVVYHLFFKALGVVLFAVEIWWFVARPIFRELREWWGQRRALAGNRNALLTGGGALALLALAVLPWQGNVDAPAIAQASPRMHIFPPFPARLGELRVKEGDTVAAGQVLAVLEAPEVTREQAVAEAMWVESRWRAERGDFNDRLRERGGVVDRELDAAAARRQGAAQLAAQLTVTAPAAGTVRDLAPGLEAGLWLGREDRLAVIAGPGRSVTAYVAEADIAAIAEGAPARFIPDNPFLPAIALVVTAIDPAASRTLDSLWLSSTRDGPIAAREPKPGAAPVPHEAVWRVVLTPTADAGLPAQVLRGHVRIEGERRSPAGRLLRLAASVLVREAGF